VTVGIPLRSLLLPVVNLLPVVALLPVVTVHSGQTRKAAHTDCLELVLTMNSVAALMTSCNTKGTTHRLPGVAIAEWQLPIVVV
jgi:hypothetical protein